MRKNEKFSTKSESRSRSAPAGRVTAGPGHPKKPGRGSGQAPHLPHLTRQDRIAAISASQADQTAIARRACAILLLAEGVQPEEAVLRSGLSTRGVYRALRRYRRQGMANALDPRPRPEDYVFDCKLSDADLAGLLAHARSEPPRDGSHWTYQKLATAAAEQGLCQSISRQALQQRLNKRGLSLRDLKAEPPVAGSD